MFYFPCWTFKCICKLFVCTVLCCFYNLLWCLLYFMQTTLNGPVVERFYTNKLQLWHYKFVLFFWRQWPKSLLIVNIHFFLLLFFLNYLLFTSRLLCFNRYMRHVISLPHSLVPFVSTQWTFLRVQAAGQVWNVRDKACGPVTCGLVGCPSPGCCGTRMDERIYAALIGRARAPSRSSRHLRRYCCSDSAAHERRWARSVHPLSDREFTAYHFRARTMEATIYQILFGELGDLNCSLMDAFQDTFLENATLSLLSTDGKNGNPVPLFLIRDRKVCVCVATWKRKPWRLRFFILYFLYKGFYCNATTDEIGTCWPRSGTGRIVERPCPEYINGVKYNTTSKMFGCMSLQKFHNMHCWFYFIFFSPKLVVLK